MNKLVKVCKEFLSDMQIIYLVTFSFLYNFLLGQFRKCAGLTYCFYTLFNSIFTLTFVYIIGNRIKWWNSIERNDVCLNGTSCTLE